MADEWQKRLGYPAVPRRCPPSRARCASPARRSRTRTPGSRCTTPAFELAGGVGTRAREDYQKMWNSLYTENRLDTLHDWLHSHNMRLRVQAYGEPIDMASAPDALRHPRGRVARVHQQPGVLQGRRRRRAHDRDERRLLGVLRDLHPPLPVDGDPVRSLRASARAAGGVTSTAWHGYSYKDAPGQAWPGWNSFGTGVTEQFGRGPQWDDWTNINLQLARTEPRAAPGQAALRRRRLLAGLRPELDPDRVDRHPARRRQPRLRHAAHVQCRDAGRQRHPAWARPPSRSRRRSTTTATRTSTSARTSSPTRRSRATVRARRPTTARLP